MIDEIDALLGKYQAKLAATQTAHEKSETVKQQFVREFVEIRRRTVRPALEKLNARLESAGHTATLSEAEFRSRPDRTGPDKMPEIALTVRLKRADGATRFSDEGHGIFIRGDASEQRVVGFSNTSRGSGPEMDKVPTSQVTAAMIERFCIAWLARLVEDASPRC
jgi:hypothetical protein